jgi:hypothetical protein
VNNQKFSECSDGSLNSRCATDSDCATGLKCDDVSFTGNKTYTCLQPTGALAIGANCNLSSDCTSKFCAKSNDGRELSGKCTDGTTGSVCYSDHDCNLTFGLVCIGSCSAGNCAGSCLIPKANGVCYSTAHDCPSSGGYRCIMPSGGSGLCEVPAIGQACYSNADCPANSTCQDIQTGLGGICRQ